ncbi:hypothetical protein LTS18_003696 [Coniosporium uncinatum]|uniref:Uncharacterized protein n=1 Tax=Coniosporium uncinatum TaxID=93489 RepID=A0ACC3DTI9_9PEZI|nr:hypothetical protein LTS18_003696 [Coniosporium uncinatum]
MGSLGPNLLDLAEELVLNVIEQINSQLALCNLARTCRRLQELTEPYIYSTVLVRTGKDAETLLESLFARPKRLSSILDLAIRYRHDREQGIEVLNPVISKIRKLKRLHVEAPCCNDEYWSAGRGHRWESAGRIDIGRLFEAAVGLPPLIQPQGLEMLQSLILHSHGPETHSQTSGVLRNSSDKYNLNRSAIIFAHPQLRHIKLSCFDVLPSLANLPFLSDPRQHHTTRLTHLTFEECNIHATGLSALLALPAALSNLIIGERIYHFVLPPFRPLMHDAPALLAALYQQRDSLAFLKHVGGIPISDIPFAHITNPEHLAVLSNVQDLALAQSSVLLRYLLHGGAPASLRVLRLLDTPMYSLDGEQELLKLIVQQVPQLQTFEIVLSQARPMELRVSGINDVQTVLNGLMVNEATRRMIRKAGTVFKGAKIRMRMFVLTPVHYIPPFMLGEEVPVEVLAWDSEDPDMFGGKVYREEEVQRVTREQLMGSEESEALSMFLQPEL